MSIEAEKVNPKKWKEPKSILYDTNGYSVIWGYYEDEDEFGKKVCRKSLGVRWSGWKGHDLGFPRQGKYPTWYVEPDFLVKSILERLLEKAKQDKSSKYLKNIQIALEECKNIPEMN